MEASRRGSQDIGELRVRRVPLLERHRMRLRGWRLRRRWRPLELHDEHPLHAADVHLDHCGAQAIALALPAALRAVDRDRRHVAPGLLQVPLDAAHCVAERALQVANVRGVHAVRVEAAPGCAEDVRQLPPARVPHLQGLGDGCGWARNGSLHLGPRLFRAGAAGHDRATQGSALPTARRLPLSRREADDEQDDECREVHGGADRRRGQESQIPMETYDV
mmetsp:Transcript_17337/g.48649  ORF Transcript_17337/g.48649 Transcript_17337/m.48649 type:complete len:220 (+) Transcript_17337:532-1191(+)